MNILLAFKSRTGCRNAGGKRVAGGGSGVKADRIFRYCEVYSVLMNRPPPLLLLAQRKNGTPMSLTALSMGG